MSVSDFSDSMCVFVVHVHLCAHVLKYDFHRECGQNCSSGVFLFERERLSGRDVPCDSLCVQQREQPSVPGCALEIPLGIGVSDLLLHSAMLYIGWLIMVLFIP